MKHFRQSHAPWRFSVYQTLCPATWRRRRPASACFRAGALALRATLAVVWLSPWLAGCSSKPAPDTSMGALGASPDFELGADDLPSSPNALPGNVTSSGCLGETRQAEAIELDMFLMLDLSGSML